MLLVLHPEDRALIEQGVTALQSIARSLSTLVLLAENTTRDYSDVPGDPGPIQALNIRRVYE